MTLYSNINAQLFVDVEQQNIIIFVQTTKNIDVV